MAVYETPVRHEDHYIQNDTGSGAGFWAVLAVVVVVLLLLLFGSNIFGRGRNSSGTNINGSVNTPSGSYQGSGTVTQ
ncbi:MAG: hypothetical protein KW802_02460 [Candidatus Doudnabacteria bacterium]|nr:hypothetical protein [Candidatus Doudnabacteria bacterium]